MNRRDVLRSSLAVGFGREVLRSAASSAPQPPTQPAVNGNGKVWTVRGPIEPKDLGVCLPHEHVMVDFIGADRVSRDRYNDNEVARVAYPHLMRLKELGAKSLADCTPAYLGRDARLLLGLSELTGLHVLTNTGYYAANGGKHLPPHALTESADQLSARWLREWKDGIDGTRVRPGFIKIGVGIGPLTRVERTLVAAAARTHLASGLTIASHTGGGRAAIEQLDILKAEGADGSAFIWVHAQSERDAGRHVEAGNRGAFVELDGVSSEPKVLKFHLDLVNVLRRRGLFQRLLLSHDAGWYHVGEPNGGDFRPYEPLFTDLLPALKAEGYEPEDIDILTVENPREAFTVRARPAR